VPPSHRWRIDKPWLTAIQQKLDLYHLRWGWVAYFIPWAPVVAVLCMGFLIVQHRLRRRISRLLAENRALIVTQERQRLARDLHDDLGAQLVRLGGQDAASAREAQLALDRAIFELDPARQTLDRLVTFLGDYAEQSFAGTGIRCFHDAPIEAPAIPLRPEVRKAVLLCCKEALANILKHSRATEVWLRIVVTQSQLAVLIDDNGVGFESGGPALSTAGGSPAETRPCGGNGLKNMRERMTQLDGSFAATRRAEGGTRVALTTPL
jgi:signal transduction histidine kinase